MGGMCVLDAGFSWDREEMKRRWLTDCSGTRETDTLPSNGSYLQLPQKLVPRATSQR